ncbi:alpha/beta hydrolase [Streptomyces sp. AK02-01A]|uniref:alpha/beta hydrolase n=1 Tax=Streptomyces sp. AK02-01A TaxID=3028648 RepID=UPI0029A7FE4C|nr:alpha/beta hydrolase [Streptomyces sp. AK02-01A]MDX3850087.1 alpha/beta hydrolase [Streptomyces sp. AK02-01A]
MTAPYGAPVVSAPASVHGWWPPAGIAPRGTLILLPGRGEHPLVYERFGRRLAADGYVVQALGTAPDDPAEDVLARAADAAGPDPAAPVVLVGSDTGALQALGTAASADPRLPVEGVVVAGAAPTGAGARAEGGTSTWDDELAARTACPAHRRRLSEDEGFERGRLTGPVPAGLLADARPGCPALILHGEADPVTSVDQARELAARLPRATLAVVHDGLHDVLNDASHRTTAAVIVLWLERLRADPGLSPLLTVERGAAL